MEQRRAMSSTMIKIVRRYRYVVRDTDRHGRTRYYFRRKGQKKVVLHSAPGTPEFDTQYQVALAASEVGQLDQPRPSTLSGQTFKWVCHRYMQSVDFKQLDPGTQRTRRLIIQHMWNEPISPGSNMHIGDCPLDCLSSKIVRVLRDRKASHPNAGNSRVKVIRRIFRWAVENELMPSNPAREVAYLRTRSSGFHTLTEAELRQFEERWPIGTKERLAFTLLRYLGVRRSDVVRLGKQHARNGVLVFATKKGAVPLELPIPPELQRVIDQSPVGDLHYLITQHGKAFTAPGFGGWFRERCDAAGLPHVSAHSLRKAAATSLAEAGATPHQLMAWFGWRTLQQAERYTRCADQKRLAASVVPLFGKTKNGT
jgi:integrase